MLFRSGSGLATFGHPTSAGVPAEVVQHTLVLEFNNVEHLEAAFAAQGAITGEKFERFDAGFVGAGDTLSAALAALLAAGSELSAAVGEALAFLDQSLDAGFRPGMGNVIPDRFFWALPPGEEGELAEGEEGAMPGEEASASEPKGSPRRVH